MLTPLTLILTNLDNNLYGNGAQGRCRQGRAVMFGQPEYSGLVQRFGISNSGTFMTIRWSCHLIYGLRIIIEHISTYMLQTPFEDEVYTFLTTAELKAIESMKAIVERITHQTMQCSYFIQVYCVKQKFWP